MLDKIIKFSIKNKIVIGIMTLLLIIWGVWSATKLSVDAVPDITNNQVQIFTSCPTLAEADTPYLVLLHNRYSFQPVLMNVPLIGIV